MPALFGNNGQLTRDERVQLYGIDCEDQIVWADWVPGNETVNDLVLQNVALVTQKVKFKLPPTKEFDMPYPEPFKLAPGMKKSIPISFRPSRYEPHLDQVQIITKGGSFNVTVKAVVKEIAITIPPGVNFGLRPTKEKAEMHLDVYNTGSLAATLKWLAKPPFAVRAPSDTLEVGSMMRCKIEFEPQTASVFEGLIALKATNAAESSATALDDDLASGTANGSVAAESEEKEYLLRAYGVGKMPHLCVPGSPQAVVEFGEVFPGNRKEQKLEIKNTTPVVATFSVCALHDNGEVQPLPPSPFGVSPDSGVVEPSCSYTMTFHFLSHTVKEFACQRFRISTPGGTTLMVTCTAFCKPMEVRLSTRSINYGEVPCGKVYTRTVQLHNNTDRPALYHFVNQDHQRGIFWLDRHMGIIPPASFMVVSVFFGPLCPGNYYKHVHCVVKGALAPLSLFLLGTSHSEKSRPAFLQMNHVDLYRNMQLDGILAYPVPEASGGGDRRQGTDRLGSMDDEPAMEDESPQEVPIRHLSATHNFLEMMLGMDSKLRDITISPTDLDFGSCSTMLASEKQVVTISNRTSQKVTVMWMVPGETRMQCNPDERSLFAVYPVQCDIKPCGQQDFNVSFRPHYESNYEGGFLEAVVFQKINRTFRLVDLKRFTPPWTLAVRGMGHTMGGTRNDPHLEISESNMRFRACSPGQRSYQVAMLTNPGDTCISYRFLPPSESNGDDTEGIRSLHDLKGSVPFRVFPTQGIIEPHKFHLVVVEFFPTVARNESAFVANFPVVVAYNEGQPKNLRVSGRAWEPKLNFCRGQPVVTFPPSCAGIVSSCLCEIQNVSEIGVQYECKIPARYRQWFSFPEPVGQLNPSEYREVEAQFCPTRDDTFSAPMYCVAKSLEDPDDYVEGPLRALVPRLGTSDVAPSYVLQFVGHGKGPAILLDPENLDLGAVRAYDEVTNHLTILNSSQLAVHYTVQCEFVGSDEQAASFAEQALQLSETEGTVAGRCTKALTIVFSPTRRGEFVYRITISPKGGGRFGNQGIPFTLTADVQYPFVQIVDLRPECATLQPQSMMWTQFQVDGINELYTGEVEEEERLFQKAIGIDEKKELVKRLKPFQLLFGTCAAGAPPTIVHLILANPSRLKLRFSFQSPKDMTLESAPYWCDEKDRVSRRDANAAAQTMHMGSARQDMKALEDEREAHFSWVEEHGIYDIQPRSGEIQPGHYTHVQMTYHHHSIGQHILQVVFNVHKGRSVLLYLKGSSVPPQFGCLSVRSSIVQLKPVSIDVARGPVQPVELSNSGGVAASWQIDLKAIGEHNIANYNYKVISVTPTEGVLEPQGSTYLHFVFTPLEAKSYQFPVRIEIMKDGRAVEELTFDVYADGYDPQEAKPVVPPAFPPTLPIQTYAPVPGCGAALSIEALDFGVCPLRACASRMLVLVNYSKDFILTYRWESRQLFHESELWIEPAEGELSPGSHCITVFRLCCSSPVDVSGEVACMLEWTHLSAYGQVQETHEDDSSSRVEYLAYHSQHVHEPMRTGRELTESHHVSVANRLTVSRFRNLMSTAAGQKFLNENLHRTAVLASHIPAMANGQNRATGRGVGNSASNAAGGPGATVGFSEAGVDRGGAQPPNSFPLYVRIRVEVADVKEGRDDFLILGPSSVLERRDDENADWGLARPKESSGEEGGPSVVAAVLEHIIREVMAESELGQIVDNMLMEETPLFAQYEDSLPPGESVVSALRFPSFDADASVAEIPDDVFVGGASMADPPVPAPSANAWRSNLLLDFLAPPSAAAPTPAGGGGDARAPDASTKDFTAPFAASHASTGGGGGHAFSSTSVGGGGGADARLAEDSPQRYWEDALRDYGEVDLEAFKVSAGEVLDKLLLDMMDDVVAGRLNWMRPLPRARPRR